MLEKRGTEARFGKQNLTLIEVIGRVAHNRRFYSLAGVRTAAGQNFVSIRLYNKQGRFVKQFLIEPEACGKLAILLNVAYDTMARGGGIKDGNK